MIWGVIFMLCCGGVVISLMGLAITHTYNYFFGKKKQYLNLQNPYIHSHLIRHANDKAYEDYLDWLGKTGGDLPIEKVKSKEELKFERELKL